MALISCPKCGSTVSEYADTCPQCGYDMKKHGEKRRRKLWAILLTAGLLAAIAAAAVPFIATGKDPWPSRHKNTKVIITAAPRSPGSLAGADLMLAAKQLLQKQPYSRSMLIAKLVFEGASQAQAAFIVDQCGVDWKEQAAKSAALYLQSHPGTAAEALRAYLIQQRFTEEEADWGVLMMMGGGDTFVGNGT